MSEADEILVIARDWVQKAENDLKNAAYTLHFFLKKYYESKII